MTNGLKIWLWIVLVVNGIACAGMVAVALITPLAWGSVVLEILVITGTAMILFARKKMGFYLICGSALLNLVVGIMLGNNIISAVFSSVIMPMIIWLLMKDTWYEFQ